MEDQPMIIAFGIIMLTFLLAIFSKIIIRAILMKFNTPWRTIERNNDFKIQQKFGRFWITTYQFCYGCSDQAEIEKSFINEKTKAKKYTRVIQEYPAIIKNNETKQRQ